MKKDGHVYRLVLDEKAEVVTYSKDLEGNDQFRSDNENCAPVGLICGGPPPTIFNSAKGTLACTWSTRAVWATAPTCRIWRV
jgi:hypothetical protein